MTALPPASSTLRPARLLPRLAVALVIALGASACGSLAGPPETFDLSLPPAAGRAGTSGRLFVVSEPVALQALESDRIVVRSGDGAISFVPNVQWSDRLPRLLQTRIVQSLENAGRAVGRSGNGLAADVALQTEIRFFGIQTGQGGAQAVVELSAKVIGSDGRLQSAKVFRSAVPVAAVNGPSAAAALDQATSRLLADLVRWAR